MTDIPQWMKDHVEADQGFQEKIQRVLFGDESVQEMGMKEKVDKMYTMLVQSQGIWGVIGGIRGTILTAVAAISLIAYLKGWFR